MQVADSVITALLPRAFEPSYCGHLVRLGAQNDGGYVVDSRAVSEAECVVSLGINDDWSFESDFLRINPVPIQAFDGSVSAWVLYKRVLKAMLSFRVSQLVARARAALSFRSFFSGSNTFHKKFAGFQNWKNYLSFDEILDSIEQNKIFIKMDIEGAEYRCLDSIIRNKHRIVGIAMELHDFDLHVEKVVEFVEKVGLKVSHVHVNNYGPLVGGVPVSLELSLSSFSGATRLERDLPNELDMPNNPALPDINITFEI